MRLFVLSSLLSALPFAAMAQGSSSASFDICYQGYLDSFAEKLLPKDSKPVQIFELSDLKSFGVRQSSKAKVSYVDAEGQGFSKAMRVEILEKQRNPFDVQAFSEKNTAAIKKGDVIFFALSMRCLETSNESGEGSLTCCLKSSGSGGWLYPFQGVAGREWRVNYGCFEAPKDFAPGDLCLHFMLSSYRQTIEFGGLLALNLGQGVDMKSLPRNALTYEGRSLDAPWRKEADARIEKFRKGDLSISVADASGKPLKGASVAVSMTRHAYRFGCYAEHPAIGAGKLSGSVWTDSDSDNYRKWFLRLFNSAAVPMFWGPDSWGWSNPKMREDYCGIADWASRSGLSIMAHCLIYEGSMYNPPSVCELAKKDPAAFKQAVYAHIKEKLETTSKYGFQEWQITNEHMLSDFMSAPFGGTPEVAEWFKLARSIDPKPRLTVNDCAPWTHNDTLDRYYAFAKELQSLGASLGAVGFQAHASGTVGIERILSVLDRFSALGVPLEATEFDVGGMDEQLQADFTRDFYTAFFSHPSTDGIITWGLWEGRHYEPSKALFRKDWSMKPNAAAYMSLVLGKWWTQTEGRSGADGLFLCRGFLGDYEITVSYGGKSKTVKATLPKGGAKLAIRFD